MSKKKIQCKNDADFRYTWPGQDEKGICLGHSLMIKKMANVIGMHLQMIPLVGFENEIIKCHQLDKIE